MIESGDATKRPGVGRRAFLKGGALGLGAAASFRLGTMAHAQSRTVKIGFVSAQSGVRANFGETTPWTIERMQAAFKDGLKIGGKSYTVEILVKDCQSDPNRSSVVT